MVDLRHGDPMTPSNVNTSGLEVVQWEYRTAPHRQWHITDSKAVAEQEAEDGSEVVPRLVRAASAQARIAELSASMTQQSDQWSERPSVMADRATAAEARIATILEGDCGCCVLTRAACADTVAEIEIGRKSAEARADRLAKALEDIRRVTGMTPQDVISQQRGIVHRALQQEG